MSHYFESPTGEGKRYEFSVELWGRPLRVTGADGVFSGRDLDKATHVLLREAWPSPESKIVLDLGCGWGPLALALAHELATATVWATDTNERARDLCALNAASTGVGDRVRVAAPDEVPDDVVFDEIWSNPPIRIGKEALHELLLTWLSRLSPTGIAWLVVGKNLGSDSLSRWLNEQGFPCEKHASAKGFRVLRVSPKQGL